MWNAMSGRSIGERLYIERGQRASEHGIEVLANPPGVLNVAAHARHAAYVAEPGKHDCQPYSGAIRRPAEADHTEDIGLGRIQTRILEHRSSKETHISSLADSAGE